MSLGQAAGAAAQLAITAAQQPDLQDLDYDVLRDLLLRGDQMLDEKIPPFWSIQVGGGVALLGAWIASAALLRRRYASRHSPTIVSATTKSHSERRPPLS
jgi:hypothetical protein